MDVEILVVPECPHRAAAVALVREVLEELHQPAAGLRVGVVATPAEARRRAMAGSPTILIDGVDPFAVPGQVGALACRIYRSGSDTNPLPDKRALRQALSDAAGDGATPGMSV